MAYLPVIHVPDQAALVRFIDCAQTNGWKSVDYPVFTPAQLLDCMDKTRKADGYDIYLCRDRFYALTHPDGINHPNLYRMNSLAQMTRYVKTL